MRMNVMLSSPVTGRPVMAWSQGAVLPSVVVDNPYLDQVLIVGEPEADGKPGSAVMMTALVPVRHTFSVVGPFPFEVQSFRIRRADGEQRWVLICAECGDCRTVSLEEVRELGTAACAKCGALPSGSGCPRWHNWGTCPECAPSVADHSRAAERACEAETRRRLAEDRQPTKAGPGAPSHGFACGPDGGVGRMTRGDAGVIDLTA